MKLVAVGGVIAALACGVSAARAEPYIIPHIGSASAHVIDLDTIRKRGPVTRFWNYTLWSQPQTIEGGTTPYTEMRSLHEFNCETEEQRTIQYSFYLGPDLAHDAELTGEEWSAVPPRTVLSTLFRAVCSPAEADLKPLDSMAEVHAAIDGVREMQKARP